MGLDASIILHADSVAINPAERGEIGFHDFAYKQPFGRRNEGHVTLHCVQLFSFSQKTHANTAAKYQAVTKNHEVT
jgi:hypothetical protein